MQVISDAIQFNTAGNGDSLDLTEQVQARIDTTGIKNGTVTVFCVGSTGGLTTIEFEPGCVHDFQQLFERIAPEDIEYRHHERWNDDNGRSHVRASLLGPSITIPIQSGRMTLGTWQQILFVDFDTRSRDRTVTLQIMGIA
jgi:secondary thiamine-phosphate synthase enzyme